MREGDRERERSALQPTHHFPSPTIFDKPFVTGLDYFATSLCVPPALPPCSPFLSLLLPLFLSILAPCYSPSRIQSLL